MANNKYLKQTLPGIVMAAVLWTVMFSPLTSPYVNFWAVMTLSGVLLTTYTFLVRPCWWAEVRFDFSNIITGVLLAMALWCVFWCGDKISQILFDFARPEVDSIYGMKSGENPWVLTVLMLFIIGPAEEIFWRGCVQNRLSIGFTPNIGFLLTTLVYAVVHVSKFNFMLVAAAAVAGFVWGLAYRLFPDKLGAIIVSHALWDCAVFIWFPI